MRTITIEKSNGVARMSEDIMLAIDLLRNGRYTVTIKAERKPSKGQAALLWMWLSAIQKATGDDTVNLYKYYCRKFLTSRIHVIGRDVEVSGTTGDLTKGEMSDFLDKVRRDALEQLGIRLPSPEDRVFEQFQERYG